MHRPSHHAQSPGALVAVAVAVVLPTTATAALAARPAGLTHLPAAHAAVVLRDIAFNPGTVTIRNSGTVTWFWRDGTGVGRVTHTLTSVGRQRFRGTAPRDRGSRTVSFTRPGIYRYVCMLHPGMAGKVVVR